MYDFEEMIYHGCFLCNQRTEFYNVVCYPCMEHFDELAYSFCGVEGLDDDDFYEAEEKYNIEEYDIFYFQRKRGYTI